MQIGHSKEFLKLTDVSSVSPWISAWWRANACNVSFKNSLSTVAKLLYQISWFKQIIYLQESQVL